MWHLEVQLALIQCKSVCVGLIEGAFGEGINNKKFK